VVEHSSDDETLFIQNDFAVIQRNVEDLARTQSKVLQVVVSIIDDVIAVFSDVISTQSFLAPSTFGGDLGFSAIQV